MVAAEVAEGRLAEGLADGLGLWEGIFSNGVQSSCWYVDADEVFWY